MDVLIAVALLFWLLSKAGKKRKEKAHKKAARRRRDELGWIDEIELFDAATDDFL